MIRRQRIAHARIWMVLAVVLPVSVALIVVFAPGSPLERPPVPLDPVPVAQGASG